MLKELREFLTHGNVVDLAVAVILGTAFGAIVTSLVDDIVMPLVGVLIGGVNFAGLSIQVGEARVLYGNFLQAVVNFVTIAAVIFLVVRTYNRLRRQADEALAEPNLQERLLTQIRDLIKEQGEGGGMKPGR
jgi:large conductance mechanosensitive channel